MKTYTYKLEDEDLDRLAFAYLERNPLYLYLNHSGKIITPLITVFILLLINHPYEGSSIKSNGVSYPEIAMKIEIAFLIIISLPMGWYLNKYFRKKLISYNLNCLNSLRNKNGERSVSLDEEYISIKTQDKEFKIKIKSITALEEYEHFIILKENKSSVFLFPKKNKELYEHVKEILNVSGSSEQELKEEILNEATKYSRSIKLFIHIPILIGSLITLLILISSEQPMWLWAVTLSMLMISSAVCKYSKKALWQILYIHSIVGYVAGSSLILALIYAVYMEGFEEGFFTFIIFIPLLLLHSKKLFKVAIKKKDFICADNS